MKRGVFTFGFLALAMAGLCFAGSVSYAASAPAQGGNTFDTATPLAEGSYTGGKIDANAALYYTLDVPPGQETTLKLQADQSSGLRGLALLDADRKEVVSNSTTGQGVTLTTLRGYTTGYTAKHFVKVSSQVKSLASFTLDIAFTDRTDAGSNKDAATDFSTALPIKLTSAVKGFLSDTKGGDTVDLYTADVSAGTGPGLTVTVTPESDLGLAVKAYDANQKEIASKSSSNAGAIVELVLPAAKITGDTLYLRVECGRATSCKTVGEYSMEFAEGTTQANANQNTSVVLTNTNASTLPLMNASVTTTSLPTEEFTFLGLSPLWLIVAGAGAFLVFVALVIFLILAIRKK